MTIDLPRPSGTPDLTMTLIEPLAPMLGARGGPHNRVSRRGGGMIFVNALFLHSFIATARRLTSLSFL
jgi:hypothetical protein